VGSAAVKLESNKNPLILYATRERILMQEYLDFNRFLTSTVDVLGKVAEDLQKNASGFKPQTVFFVFASPWYASQTRIVRYKRDDEFLVTREGVDQLINKEVDNFRNTKIHQSGKESDELPQIVEVKNIQIKLNGYETDKPFGKHANEIEIVLYISVSPTHIINKFKDSVGRIWHSDNVLISSFSYVSFDTIRDIYMNEKNFLFLDITGEVTDISLVHNNILYETVSFPVGKYYLLRAIAEESKISLQEAMSRMALYMDGKMKNEDALKLARLLDSSLNRWHGFFEDALKQFSQELTLPHQIFFTADSDVGILFEKIMSSTDATKYILDDQQFIIKSLGINFLSNFVRFKEQKYKDVFLSLEAFYANKVFILNNE